MSNEREAVSNQNQIKLYWEQSARKRRRRKTKLIITFKLDIKENLETYYVIQRLLDLNIMHQNYSER